MPVGTELTTVESVHESGSFLFTATDEHGIEEEIILVPCENTDGEAENSTDRDASATDDGASVRAWINRCTHESQRFDTGRGVPMRGGQIVCPRHGSLFDACSGACDNGEAAGTTLPEVSVTVHEGSVYLSDFDYGFASEGGIDDGSGPSSTSHVGF